MAGASPSSDDSLTAPYHETHKFLSRRGDLWLRSLVAVSWRDLLRDVDGSEELYAETRGKLRQLFEARSATCERFKQKAEGEVGGGGGADASIKSVSSTAGSVSSLEEQADLVAINYPFKLLAMMTLLQRVSAKLQPFVVTSSQAKILSAFAENPEVLKKELKGLKDILGLGDQARQLTSVLDSKDDEQVRAKALSGRGGSRRSSVFLSAPDLRKSPASSEQVTGVGAAASTGRLPKVPGA